MLKPVVKMLLMWTILGIGFTPVFAQQLGELIVEPDLLNLLVKQRRVVKVRDGVVFAASAYDEMVRKVADYIKEHGKVTLAEVRDLFGTSRKYAQALLEYLDEKKITRRTGDERVLR